ncbi:MAG: FHA domain-containing protein [Planctomycetales bacterium]|nr:FHA domain-containing protein [Planctomycetales bacterium]
MTHQAQVELVAWHPTGFTLPFVVRADQSVLVGKSTNCGVRLRGHDIADIHCSIGLGDGQLWVQDWTSASGTKVNGDPVTSKTYVGQGCVVEIGSYKIQVSTANKGTLESGADGDTKLHAASTPVDKEHSIVESIEHSSSKSIPPSAVSAVSATPKREMSASAPAAVEHLAPTEHAELAYAAFQDKGLAPLVPPTSGIDLLTQEDETYDRETVELLLAEIDDLRTALAQADSKHINFADSMRLDSEDADESDRVLSRIQELSEEANRAEERVLLLEEMLHAAEDANRSEVEERSHLEAWVGDIEKRVGQREAEHAAELEALRERLDLADKANVQLQRQLQHAVAGGDGTDSHDEDVLEQLQLENGKLQNALVDVTKDLRQLKQKFENQSEESETALREERAKIAREHADMSRLKYEYAQKIKELEELPMSTAHADPSRQSVLEHRQQLREMNREKKERPLSQSLSGRLKRIWNRID